MQDIKDFEFSHLQEMSNGEYLATVKAAGVTAGLHYLSYNNQKLPWEILGLKAPEKIVTSFTIGIDTVENMVKEIADSKCPILKLKMGFPEELELAERLSDFPNKWFRIDVNGGWTPDRAEEVIYYLKKGNVQILEQPTGLDDVHDWKYLKGRGQFLMTIDEGLASIEDYFKFADWVDGINIKMAKSGGAMTARNLARTARKNGTKVMLGCMVESSIGIAPALYMASLADYFDLDGPLLLKNDISDDIKYNVEKIVIEDSLIGGPKIRKDYFN